jgi:GMP synthase-like glutamine amidotransferase
MTPRRGLILTHGDEAPPALLAEWLSERGCAYELHDATRSRLPALAPYDLVASLGSTASARSREPAWVPAELALLRAAIASDIPVLGLCFGGQALSIALGGEVVRAAAPRIGWYEVKDAVEDVPAGPWFHWHYEQLRLPPGAQALARGQTGTAGFRHGRHLGLQFHPEVTLEVIEQWCRSEAELERAGVNAERLLADSAVLAPAARRHAWELFELWWRWLAGPGA